MIEILAAILGGAVRSGTSVLFACLGELIAERAGVWASRWREKKPDPAPTSSRRCGTSGPTSRRSAAAFER